MKRIALALAPLVLLAYAVVAGEGEAAKDGQFKGKTAQAWVAVLSSGDVQSRAEAAEALGFLAREGQLTYGGFSDVPIDSPEPPKWEAGQLRPIIAALSKGLQDPQAKVRAAAAVAISWIGPRASAAVPELILRLDDSDASVRKNALKAIGRMGGLAKDAASRLRKELAQGNGHYRVEVAGTLRQVEAETSLYVPTLIELLGHAQGNSPPAHYAAMELAQAGDVAVPALLVALSDGAKDRRMFAAYALANMAGLGNLKKNQDSVAVALVALAKENDAQVLYKAAQALGALHAAPAQSVPALIRLLSHSDSSVSGEAADALGEFGVGAREALPTLVEVLQARKGRDALGVGHAIRKIGLDRKSADAISEIKLGLDGAWLVQPMCEFPEAAARFLKFNPESVDVPMADRDFIIRLMRDDDPQKETLQALLFDNDHLPLGIMAQMADRRFLTLIERRRERADAYERTKLDACARACGAPVQRTIAMSESQPGDFKPQSAWPGVDPARQTNALGHGDGFTEIIVTGRLANSAGEPVASPKFYRTNDSFLLGERVRNEIPVTYEPKSGRFVLVTHIFAAYSVGRGQKESGPYQTGSSMTEIEAEGCKPLTVQFFDEMPDVAITLSKQ